MNRGLAMGSSTQVKSGSLRDAIIQLVTEKLSDESRVSKIIAIVNVRYSHLSSEVYEKALEPLLCLDPTCLYRLLRDCNEQIDGLSDESGLIHFKNTIFSSLSQLIETEVSPEILSSSEVSRYAALSFSKLAGTKRKLALEEELIASLQAACVSTAAPVKTSGAKVSSLSPHLSRSIEASKAYLLAALAKSRSNAEFRSMVGMDVIKASYTSLKLTTHFPNLQAGVTAQATVQVPSRSCIATRIYEEAISRYMRGLRMNEGSLHELSEYVSKITSLQEAESQAASLKKSISSLRSDFFKVESERDSLLQQIIFFKNQHSEDIARLQSLHLADKRASSAGNAELGQKIRSILIDSLRRIDSEIQKLELQLRISAKDTATPEKRLMDRIRKTIADLESKILGVFS